MGRWFACAALAIGCASGHTGTVDSGPGRRVDAGGVRDGGARTDGGLGSPDAGARDAGTRDTGPSCASDVDGDGVCDAADLCQGFPDSADADGDGTPDGCDCDATTCMANATCVEGPTGAACNCDPGFMASGETCVPAMCEALTAPANGSVSAPDTSIGSAAAYSCNSGYSITGVATRICQDDGTWSGDAPSCTIVDCGALTAPANGTVNAPTTTFGATATYSCNGGFTLSGPATRTCQADGTWSGSVPTCQGSVSVTFPAGGDPRLASADVYFWRLGDFVQGSRSTPLSSVSEVSFTLQVSPNTLTCDNQDTSLRINGVLVGSFAITPGASVVSRTFAFAPISGPTYTLRLETTRTVGSGCGSAGFPEGVSTFTLRP